MFHQPAERLLRKVSAVARGCARALSAGLISLLVLYGTGATANAQNTAPAGAGGAANSVRGQQLLAQYQCGSCHAIPGVPAASGKLGPTLQAFGKRSYIAGQIPNRPDALIRWIVEPASLVPGTIMPSMGVSVADARAMAAYLGTLE